MFQNTYGMTEPFGLMIISIEGICELIMMNRTAFINEMQMQRVDIPILKMITFASVC